MIRPVHRNRQYAILLLALIALAVGPVLIGGAGRRTVATDVAFLAVLSAGTLVAARSHVHRFTVAGLAIAAAVAQIASFVSDTDTMALSAVVLHAAFLAVVTVSIVQDVLRARRVRWDTVFGGICAYLLIGVLWAMLYEIVLSADPAALGSSEPDGSRPPLVTVLYFSFSTLSTLGYGDVVPVSPIARTLAWLEAILGQVYLVVLVARLVGLHVAASEGTHGSDGDGRDVDTT